MARKQRYEIRHRITGLVMFTAWAEDETAALNEYAGWRSGYETFARMAQSATFRPFTNVHAVLAEYQPWVSPPGRGHASPSSA